MPALEAWGTGVIIMPIPWEVPCLGGHNSALYAYSGAVLKETTNLICEVLARAGITTFRSPVPQGS